MNINARVCDCVCVCVCGGGGKDDYEETEVRVVQKYMDHCELKNSQMFHK
jgi:hypothetical protein